MIRIGVYFDYYEDKPAPIWLFVHFGRGGIDWERTQLTLPVEAPFFRVFQEGLSDETLSVSINLEDLTINPDRPGHYSIHLENVLARLKRSCPSLNPSDVEQFVIQVGDLEEILQMDVRGYYRI